MDTKRNKGAKGEKAFSYLRVSGRGQIDGDGFPRQRDTVGKFAKAHSIQVIEEFRDEGVSGTKELEHRAGLAALLDRLDANGVRLVLVEGADRLARDLMVSEIILRQFKDRQVRVIEARSGTDLTAGEGEEGSATHTLIRQVLGAVAEFEKKVLVLKLKAARDRKRKQDPEGRCEGRKPYGDKPGEAEIRDRILALRRAVKGKGRQSFADIAEQLNRDGVKTRYGGPWRPSTVYNVVKANAPQLAPAKP